MAAPGELPDVEISDSGVKVFPLDNCVQVQVSPLAELVNAQEKETTGGLLGRRDNVIIRWPEFKNWQLRTLRRAGSPEIRAGAKASVYTHISDQYRPFYTCIISRVRDSTHVLDGLLYYESDLEIREHYTDTAGFTDHVFAFMHLLEFAFCSRIRVLHDKKMFIKGKADQYTAL